MTTLATVGYGDQIPATSGGRLVAVGVMVLGVAILGAVAAVVAITFASVIGAKEERTVQAEATADERRVDQRLEVISERLVRIEAALARVEERRSDT